MVVRNVMQILKKFGTIEMKYLTTGLKCVILCLNACPLIHG